MEKESELQRLNTLLNKRGSLKFHNWTTKSAEAGERNGVRSPLKNEYIMRMIFDLCSVTTLKSCRLVSTEWRDISLSSWRNKAVVRLGESGSSLRKGSSELPYHVFIKLYRSENNALQLRDTPFKNYHLQIGHDWNDGKRVLPISSPVSLHLTLSSYVQLICDFKTTILSQFRALESLELSNCKLTDSLFPYQLQSQKSWNSITYPNLKRLKITNSSFDGRSAERIWTTLLRCFPNLEALSCRSVKSDNGHNFYFVAGFMKILTDKANRIGGGGGLHKDLSFTSLKELEIWDMPQIVHNAIMTITTNHFSLERLTLDLNYGLGTSSYLTMDLIAFNLRKSKFRGTLQYLRLCLRGRTPSLSQKDNNHWKPDLRKREIVSLDALKELSLAPALPQGLYFLNLLDAPKLVKLALEKVDNDQDPNDPMLRPATMSFANETSCKSLHTLEFLDNSRIPSPKLIDALAKIMPNLLHLTIPLDKHSFQVVCRRFTRLRTLNILHAQSDYEEIDEETLTGVPVTVRAGASRLPPNITDLKDLTDFSISCERQLLRGDVGFTDHAVIHGFLKVPRLHFLSVAFKKLSGNVKARLHAHVKGSIHIQEVRRGQPHPGYFDLEIDNAYGNDDEEHERSKNFDKNDSDETSDDDNGNLGAADPASENDKDQWQAAAVEDEVLAGEKDSHSSDSDDSDNTDVASSASDSDWN